MTLPTTPASLKVIASNTPLIDVRAPVEFAQGSLPGAVNLPLMVDEERHQVGIAYKQQGQQAVLASFRRHDPSSAPARMAALPPSNHAHHPRARGRGIHVPGGGKRTWLSAVNAMFTIERKEAGR